MRSTCTICPSTFSYKTNLIEHLKKVHGVVNVAQPARRQSVIQFAPRIVQAVQQGDIKIAPQMFDPDVPAAGSNAVSVNSTSDEDDICMAALKKFEYEELAADTMKGVFKYKMPIMGGSSYTEQLHTIKNVKTIISLQNPDQDQLCYKWAIIANHIMVKEGFPVSEELDQNVEDGEVINYPTLRDVYAEYHEIYNCPGRMCEWVSRSALLLRKHNLDFDFLRIFMNNNFSDDSVPADETIIQLTFPQIYDFGHVIMQHKQYFIFVQLLHECRRITIIQLEENIQSFGRVQHLLWRLKTNYILRMLLHLDGDSTSFIIERFESLCHC